ncbi:MAG: NADH:ubiquinone reductase (Na(+)-transporting) subunit D [Saprospiraceae bacterium]|jgi:Na+-transporting NADH:ubiquinone oxidoreductase subunit D|nr:NADH:ubiquinone reductase (Na(+)-transporting) subunit D [Saprospiraceae bacterium]MBK6480786.1 NADH:ubiquinone reductase (Na(+)-transporting) subunit D [Saprospiraceae bacterium]MBK6816856.1 NADH:ubiquinone reductase (Na(+)-transporting) subunit D [Saprospiraceae bacterium]MBK7371384.1 NADH:ubiquinone reductase (Na(+)-transporting) subunit D [Saprospiraceae bacterium]MBK7436121.1 NADH:ubiquinone reductase (Na(+)-transporting) subunit D [Saprospiraceae bacterium]
MSDSAVKSLQVVEPNEPIFGKKERALITDPLHMDNPITVQVLGVCSALAVTTMVKPALIMGISVMLVTGFSNLVISALRNTIPKQIRMIVQLVVIAALVTIVEQFLKAFSYDVWKQLAVFIGLIITNCIVMGRLEAYAMANKPWPAFLDGIGNGLGYAWILVAIAAIREFFGRGALLGFKILGPSPDFLINTQSSKLLSWYQPNGLMVLPASAMFLIATIIWIQRSKESKLIDIS